MLGLFQFPKSIGLLARAPLLSRHPLPTTEATWHGRTVDGSGSGSLTVWLVGLLAGRASECVYEQFALKTPDGGGFD
jgi:hypothetical protein